MLDVLGDVIPFGVGVALSPFPIIAVLLLLTAPVGVRGGALFLLGRAVGFAALTALFAVLADVVDTAAGSTLPVAVLRIVLGALLIVVAVRKFAEAAAGARAIPFFRAGCGRSRGWAGLRRCDSGSS